MYSLPPVLAVVRRIGHSHPVTLQRRPDKLAHGFLGWVDRRVRVAQRHLIESPVRASLHDAECDILNRHTLKLEFIENMYLAVCEGRTPENHSRRRLAPIHAEFDVEVIGC